MKKMCERVLAMLLVAVFVVGLCSTVRVRAEEEKQYVVILKNGRETVKKAGYRKKAAQVQTIAEQETDSQVMTLILTESEAERMREDANVVAVSEDLEVTAFFENPGPDEPDGARRPSIRVKQVTARKISYGI